MKQWIPGNFLQCSLRRHISIPVKRPLLCFLILQILILSTPLNSLSLQEQINIEKDHILLLRDKEYYKVLLDRIDGARKEIIMSMYLFTTSGKRRSPPNRIKTALIRAAKRGVEVRVLLETEDVIDSHINYENTLTARKLLSGGIHVYFDSPHRRTHVKALVIDRRFVFIGSHNLTGSALRYNHELSVMIDSQQLAEKVRKYILTLIKNSRSIKSFLP